MKNDERTYLEAVANDSGRPAEERNAAAAALAAGKMPAPAPAKPKAKSKK